MSPYHVYISRSGLPHSVLVFLVPSICMHRSRCHKFLIFNDLLGSEILNIKLDLGA